MAEESAIAEQSPGHLVAGTSASALRPNMNSQEAWKRLANQLQKASVSGGRGGVPGGKGVFAGGGLLIALVAGGIALNASLFNGAFSCRSVPRMSHQAPNS